MSDPSSLLLIAFALLARVGQVLIAFSAGRARSAATSAFRTLLDLAVTVLVFTILRTLGVFDVSIYEASAPLASMLLAGGLIPAILGERSTLRATLTASLLYSLLIIPIAFRLIPLLTSRGFLDEAGISLFHLTAGGVGLIAALFVGPRDGRFHRDGAISVIPAHQLPLLLAGSLTLLTAWTTISTLIAGGGARRPVLLLVALCAGMLTSALYARWRFGKLDPVLPISGAFSAITAVSVGIIPTRFDDLYALLTGAAAGFIGVYLLLYLERKLKLDDLPGIAVPQAAGATTGLLLAPLLCHEPSLFQFLTQALGAALMLVLPLLLAPPAFLLLRRFAPLRVREEIEYEGQDLSTLDVNAYPDFSQPMIRSSHTREI